MKELSTDEMEGRLPGTAGEEKATGGCFVEESE